MRLCILGSGDAFSGHSCNAGALINDHLLVDCGAPVNTQLRKAGLDTSAVDTVLVTHFHADHTFALPMLLGAHAYIHPGKELLLAGPPGLREYVERMLRMGYGSGILDFIRDKVRLSYRVLQDGDVTELAGYSVECFAMVHSTGPSLGYVISDGDVAVGMTGDTAVCAGLHRLIARSTTVVCECTGWDEPVHGGHLCREEIEALMAQYPDAGFILSHQILPRATGRAAAAHDLMVFDLGEPATTGVR